MSVVIVLTPSPRHPKRGYAFSPDTDPYETLARLCWAYVDGTQSVCGYGCPATADSYCLDCHNVAASARDAATRRFP